MNQKTVNGHGFFRKSKAYGLVCGIALGLALLGNQVSADEVTGTEPAKAEMEQVATQTVVEPAPDSLNEAIDEAKKAGVEVSQTDTQTVKDEESAKADYVKQAVDVATVTEKQEEINAQNEKIKSANQDLTNAYDSAKAQADQTNKLADQAKKDYPAAVKDVVVDYGNGKDTVAYQKGEEKAKAVEQANQKAVSDYLKEKEKVDAHNARVKAREDQLKNNNLAKDEDNLLYVTGEFDKSKTGLDYYKNIKVVTLDPNSHAVKTLGWQDNTTIVDAKGVTVVPHDTANDPAIRGTSSDFLYKVTDVSVGDKFTLKNIGSTADGAVLHAVVTVTKASNLTDKEGSWFLIGKTIDNGLAVDYWNYDKLGFSIQFLNDDNQALKLVIASVVGDVDNGQTSKVEFDANNLHYINPDGSGLVPNADKSLTGAGFAVDGYQHAPRGTYLMIGSSPVIEYVHTSDAGVINSNGNIVTYIEFDLFGTASLVELEEFKYLPQPKLNISKVNRPTQPVLTGFKDNLKANFHLNQYKHNLTVVKDVLDVEGKSIDNGTLKVGDKGTYTLLGSKILANGKDKLVKYDFEDVLDTKHDKYFDYKVYAFVPIKLTDGTVIKSMEDLKAFAKQTYDEATGRFYVSLNSDFLAKVAKDSDFQAKIDVLFERISAGEVTNVFTNQLGFSDGTAVEEMPVPSNPVKTRTPEPPAPETPKPTPPAPKEEPKIPQPEPVKASVLPETGEAGSVLTVLGSVLLSSLGLVGLRKRKKA
ncbi:LPXTG cell wall anchor domain-containing protein [Streptococcus minor]|uniref:LPXTG cell wall anchor domain-containing protein n=1 Tax=Streptococcus minor TaxID=229549 RepID=A0A3P1VBF3_9STRE|nr:putative cross-wall-targeting lipoprotein signal domain-containing proteiin [Streptococcus minor]RRD31489.1 LPXTG cell wall anchor domain-containing protein [Streptococcus minor]